MTTAEKVKKAVAEYLRIDLAQVTDDMKVEDHMAPTFIGIKKGLPYSGTIGGEITVGELVAAFEKSASVHEPAWEYEESPKIESVHDAVVAVAKHASVKREDVVDSMAVEFKGYEERDAFSNHMFRLLGFSLGLDYRNDKTTVRELASLYEGCHVVAQHGI